MDRTSSAFFGPRLTIMHPMGIILQELNRKFSDEDTLPAFSHRDAVK